MADVYRAQDERLGREVALKAVPPEFERDPERVERFRREVRAAARLTHPNIVTVYEFGQGEGQHFYTMELMPGGDLKGRIRAHPEGMPPEEAPGGGGGHGPGAGLRPRAGLRAPGRKTGEYSVRGGRIASTDRFRDRSGGLGKNPDDGHGDEHRLAPLHEPRAGPGSVGGRPQRYLFAGGGDLRDADRAAAVRFGRYLRGWSEPYQRSGAEVAEGSGGLAAPAGAVDGQVAGEPLRQRGRGGGSAGVRSADGGSAPGSGARSRPGAGRARHRGGDSPRGIGAEGACSTAGKSVDCARTASGQAAGCDGGRVARTASGHPGGAGRYRAGAGHPPGTGWAGGGSGNVGGGADLG